MFLRIIPADEKVSDDEEMRSYVKHRLKGMVARVGDVLDVLMLGHPIGFRVLEARPEEGRIGEDTEFLFEGLEPAREMAPHLRDMQLYWSKRSLSPFYARAFQGDLSITVAEFDPTRASKLGANRKLWSYYGLKVVEKE